MLRKLYSVTDQVRHHLPKSVGIRLDYGWYLSISYHLQFQSIHAHRGGQDLGYSV
jgi:hypothetical protein